MGLLGSLEVMGIVGDCLLTRVMGESAMYSMMRRRARSARRSGALSGCNL
jgi:hypothetical protein